MAYIESQGGTQIQLKDGFRGHWVVLLKVWLISGGMSYYQTVALLEASYPSSLMIGVGPARAAIGSGRV